MKWLGKVNIKGYMYNLKSKGGEESQMKNIKLFSIMLVFLCCGVLVSCGGYSSFEAAKNTSAVSPDNKMKSSSLPVQTNIKGNEPEKPDDSENKGDETITEQPQKKNALEELSGEIGCCKASDWEKKIDEDERYIFVLTKYKSTKSILRIDKDTNERICIAKAPKDSFINFLYVYAKKLYYVMSSRKLYQYNLTTGETKLIYSAKEDIFGMKIYKDNIYLYECGLGISRLDPETNKRKELVDDNVSHAVFHNNKLYYIKRRYEEKIRCLDLDSGKDVVVRKLEDKEKKSHYAELFTYRDQLCYVLAGQQRQIRILGEKGEDSLLFSLEKDQVWRWELIDHFDRIINYDENLLYYVYTKEEQSWLCCYDEGEKFQMKLPEDYWEGGYVCDGYFFYNTSQSRGYISKCVPLNN